MKNRKKNLILLLICLLAIICFVSCKIFNLYDISHYNQNDIKDESILLKENYINNYCFDEEEVNMISKRFEKIDVFDNDIFEISKCGDIRISYDKKDYVSFGILYFFSNSSFLDIKKYFELNNYNDVVIHDTWISVIDELGELRFYKDESELSFRVVYITKLPYKYNFNEIDSYSEFVKLFLKLNIKNN